MIHLLLALTFSSLTFAQQKFCFFEVKDATSALKQLDTYHLQLGRSFHRFKGQYQTPKFEMILGERDQFGRTYCVGIADRKFLEWEKDIIARFQRKDDQENELQKKLRLISSLKDPWGGDPLKTDGRSKSYRSCSIDLSLCEDLVVTALTGEDGVVEYRFWLGGQAGEPMSVYKAANNPVELSKVFSLLKKDKSEQKYTFAPKSSGDPVFIEDAKIGGN